MSSIKIRDRENRWKLIWTQHWWTRQLTQQMTNSFFLASQLAETFLIKNAPMPANRHKHFGGTLDNGFAAADDDDNVGLGSNCAVCLYQCLMQSCNWYSPRFFSRTHALHVSVRDESERKNPNRLHALFMLVKFFSDFFFIKNMSESLGRYEKSECLKHKPSWVRMNFFVAASWPTQCWQSFCLQLLCVQLQWRVLCFFLFDRVGRFYASMLDSMLEACAVGGSFLWLKSVMHFRDFQYF